MRIDLKKDLIILIYSVLILFGFSSVRASGIDEDVLDMGFEYVEIDGQQIPVSGTVTVDDATEYVKEKGYKIVSFMINIAKPITLVVMVVCGLMAIISGLGGSKGSGSWIWAAVVSSICYVAVTFSPIILNSIQAFFAIK